MSEMDKLKSKGSVLCRARWLADDRVQLWFLYMKWLRAGVLLLSSFGWNVSLLQVKIPSKSSLYPTWKNQMWQRNMRMTKKVYALPPYNLVQPYQVEPISHIEEQEERRKTRMTKMVYALWLYNLDSETENQSVILLVIVMPCACDDSIMQQLNLYLGMVLTAGLQCLRAIDGNIVQNGRHIQWTHSFVWS